ncbi:MAG: hypothetical protein ACFE8A_12200 [Candidatus Hodarchaeota archaeon]
MGKYKYSSSAVGEIMGNVAQSLKRNYTTIISLAIAIVLPWILTLIFIHYLVLARGLTYELAADPSLWFRITIFYTLNLSYEMPILGFGYSLCMIVWAAIGFFIGLYTRKMGKSLIIALIGIGTTYFLYLPLVYLGGKTFPEDMIINPLIFTRLYEDFTLETPIFLLYHITFHSFALPVLIMFTLLGSMLNSPREFEAPPAEVVPKKAPPKVIKEPEVKAKPEEIVENPAKTLEIDKSS